MTDIFSGRILCGTGGLYTVLAEDGRTIKCRACGLMRMKNITPLAGDIAQVRHGDGEEKGYFIKSVKERKTRLLRPAVANIDTVFVSLSPCEPEPSLFYTDKLLAVISSSGIKAAVVITKSELSEAEAERLGKIYSAGYRVFFTSSERGEGIAELSGYIRGKTVICAFAGASGVGKSTLINAVFPDLALKTGAISERSQRGKHTTRTATLFPVGEEHFIADTPGFSLIDAENTDGISTGQLFFAFPEFEPYFGKCRYRSCTHTKEEDCAVINAVKSGGISKSRHESYVRMFEEISHTGK